MSFWDILFISYLGIGTASALVSIALFHKEKDLGGLYVAVVLAWPFYFTVEDDTTFKGLLRKRLANKEQDVLRRAEQLEQDYQEVLKLIEWQPLEERLTQRERPLC